MTKKGRAVKPSVQYITYYQCLCTLKTYERSKRHTNIQKIHTNNSLDILAIHFLVIYCKITIIMIYIYISYIYAL